MCQDTVGLVHFTFINPYKGSDVLREMTDELRSGSVYGITLPLEYRLNIFSTPLHALSQSEYRNCRGL